jgi:hypothetical protein
MASFNQTLNEINGLSRRQKEFYELVGLCITAWAAVEEKLFDICEHILRTERRYVSVIFYRTPTITTRLELTEELLLLALPQRKRRSGGHDHPSMREWKQIKKEIGRLLPERNALAHDPVTLKIHPPTTLPLFPGRMLSSTETLEVSTGEREKLRGQGEKRVRDSQLVQHLTEVKSVTERLSAFVSKTFVIARILLRLPPYRLAGRILRLELVKGAPTLGHRIARGHANEDRPGMVGEAHALDRAQGWHPACHAR